MRFATSKLILSTLLGLASLTLLAAPAKADLVINGGFELPSISANTFIISNAVPGWTLGAGSLGTGIEIQRENVAGHAFEGVQFCELDSNGNTAIFQDLLTEIGKTYQLSFAFSPRAGVAENLLHINWDGALIDTLNESGVGNGDTVWKTYTYNVTATKTTTRLGFDNLGSHSDSLGTYIDNVSVRIPEPGSLALILVGGLSVAGMIRRRR